VSTIGFGTSRGSSTRAQPHYPAGAPGPSRAEAAFLVAVIAAGAALLLPLHLGSPGQGDWLLFALLTACASIVQLLSVETPAAYSYSTTLVFFVAGALLLPSQLVALTVVLALLPEWARARYPWHVQAFNAARWICASLAACLIFGALVDRSNPDHDLSRLALGGAIAAAAWVLVDNGLLAQMLKLSRGTTFRESGLFGFGNLSTELVLASLGVGLAAVWELAPAIVPFLLAPLLVVYRALRLPGLELAARLDPKTDLFNARYLASALETEIERARRFSRPLSIILADLDLLREVNNTYGHLAGDAVLRGVADLLRRQLRPFDIPCRFGGEEFAIILPEAGHEDALATAERIRRAVAAARFVVHTRGAGIRATVSLGVATYPDCRTADDLVHQADLALYCSKALGRNRASGREALGAPPPEDAAPGRPAGDAPEHVNPTYLETIAALARSIERDSGNGWVRPLSVALARSLGYRAEDLEAIEIGALVHDVGTIGVPERILNKPGPLTDDEWEQVKEHPVASDRILSGFELHPFVRQIARWSHERVDGRGYPDGLAGEEIPLPARIVLVADALDALASDRPYRSARSITDALEVLRTHAGTQFCPTVVDAVERLWRDRPEALQDLLAESPEREAARAR
jgi:diguanylate cyclase (GGDEF)-like protein